MLYLLPGSKVYLTMMLAFQKKEALNSGLALKCRQANFIIFAVLNILQRIAL